MYIGGGWETNSPLSFNHITNELSRLFFPSEFRLAVVGQESSSRSSSSRSSSNRSIVWRVYKRRDPIRDPLIPPFFQTIVHIKVGFLFSSPEISVWCQHLLTIARTGRSPLLWASSGCWLADCHLRNPARRAYLHYKCHRR